MEGRHAKSPRSSYPDDHLETNGRCEYTRELMREPLDTLVVCRREEWVEVRLTGGVSGKTAYMIFVSWPYCSNMVTDVLKAATSLYTVPQVRP